jgi:hypothetical protein
MRGRLALPGLGRLRALVGRARIGSGPGRAALMASILWSVLVLAYALGFLLGGGAEQPRGTVFLDGMFFLIALFLPLLLIWLSAWLAVELVRQREAVALLTEATAPLIGALEEIRRLIETARPASGSDVERAVQAAMRGVQTDLAALVGQLRAARKEPGGTPAAGARSDAPEPRGRPMAGKAGGEPRRERPAGDAGQPDLPLLPEAPLGRPDLPELVRALDFPRDAGDHEGFRALERALKHHALAQTLQAAEDVLNILSQEGIYMEDLAPVPGDPAAWRAFVGGERGAGVASVGGVLDAPAIETARGLMRSDPIFRDSALFFQRRFGRVLADCAERASDGELIALADTRSGRAFQLLARVNGAFE